MILCLQTSSFFVDYQNYSASIMSRFLWHDSNRFQEHSGGFKAMTATRLKTGE